MTRYFQIGSVKNHKELQMLINNINLSIENSNPVILKSRLRDEIILSITKPDDCTKKKWGRLYTNFSNNLMMPVSKLGKNYIDSKLSLFIAVSKAEYRELSKSENQQLEAIRKREQDALLEIFHEIDLANDVFFEHDDRLKNIPETHPLSGLYSEVQRANRLRERAFNNIINDDPKNSIKRIDAALADPAKLIAEFWIQHRHTIENQGDMSQVL